MTKKKFDIYCSSTGKRLETIVLPSAKLANHYCQQLQKAHDKYVFWYEEYREDTTSARPTWIENADLQDLVDTLEEYMQNVEDGDADYSEGGWEYLIYSKTLTTFYGDDVFKYINSQIQRQNR